VELLEVRDEIVRLRLEGNCHHCSSSALTMQHTVEEAIYGKAPEITSVEVEGMIEVGKPMGSEETRIALPVL